MEAATATLVGEPQLPTAPELPMPSTSSNGSGGNNNNNNKNNNNLSTNAGDNVVNTENIGWARAKPDASSELRHRATSYSFTGSALSSGNIADLNEAGAAGTASSAPSNPTEAGGTNDKEQNDESLYECNICLDTAKDAVVSMCGHLFCWPCLHQWLLTRPNRKLCPVCKASVDKDKVIPLYGRNSTHQEDPRNKVPPRPAGQRTEPEPAPGFPGFGFGDSFHMSFGIGAFPFGFFTSSLNFGEPRPAAANRGTTQYDDEQTLSRLFLYLAFLCIGWLLFA